MAIRILSGIIKPDEGHRSSGTATIEFQPHSVHGNVVPIMAEDHQTIGPESRFRSEPCKTLSLREIRLLDQDHSKPSEAVNEDAKHYQINDSFDATRTTSLTVKWRAIGRGSEIREMSYMIVGEVR